MEKSQALSEVLASITELTQEVHQLRGEVADLRTKNSKEISIAQSNLMLEIVSTRKKDRRHVTDSTRDVVRQVEAMWQLFQKVPVPRASMPPSGGFPMEARTLLHLSVLLEELRPKNILEIGGGTSTIWMGYLTESLGTKIVSVDHLEEYGAITRDYVQRHGFSDRIDCRIAPLELTSIDDRTYSWYSTGSLEHVTDIDLLLVDGPPESTGERARFPALPVFQDKLSPGAFVVLDDTHREDEESILREWSQLGSGFTISDRGVSRLGVLKPQA